MRVMRLNTLFFGLAFLILGSVAFYPLYMLPVFCLDYTFGARLLWQSLVYESKSHTISLMLSDWLLALPFGAAVCVLLMLPELLRSMGLANTVVAFLSAAVIVAIVLIVRLLGFEGTQLVPVGFATLVIALGSRLASRYHRAHR